MSNLKAEEYNSFQQIKNIIIFPENIVNTKIIVYNNSVLWSVDILL